MDSLEKNIEEAKEGKVMEGKCDSKKKKKKIRRRRRRISCIKYLLILYFITLYI